MTDQHHEDGVDLTDNDEPVDQVVEVDRDEPVDQVVEVDYDEPVDQSDDAEAIDQSDHAEAVVSTDARDPRIAAAVARLDGLGDQPPAEHVEVYEEVHRVLQESLADANHGTDRADGQPGGSQP